MTPGMTEGPDPDDQAPEPGAPPVVAESLREEPVDPEAPEELLGLAPPLHARAPRGGS